MQALCHLRPSSALPAVSAPRYSAHRKARTSFAALTMPAAMTSHFMMPPAARAPITDPWAWGAQRQNLRQICAWTARRRLA